MLVGIERVAAAEATILAVVDPPREWRAWRDPADDEWIAE
jgi:hypothetical protein